MNLYHILPWYIGIHESFEFLIAKLNVEAWGGNFCNCNPSPFLIQTPQRRQPCHAWHNITEHLVVHNHVPSNESASHHEDHTIDCHNATISRASFTFDTRVTQEPRLDEQQGSGS